MEGAGPEAHCVLFHSLPVVALGMVAGSLLKPCRSALACSGVQVRDFRNDVILAEACHGDVEKLCKNEPAGGPPLCPTYIYLPTQQVQN